jgi:hypothetical protein
MLGPGRWLQDTGSDVAGCLLDQYFYWGLYGPNWSARFAGSLCTCDSSTAVARRRLATGTPADAVPSASSHMANLRTCVAVSCNACLYVTAPDLCHITARLLSSAEPTQANMQATRRRVCNPKANTRALPCPSTRKSLTRFVHNHSPYDMSVPCMTHRRACTMCVCFALEGLFQAGSCSQACHHLLR